MNIFKKGFLGILSICFMLWGGSSSQAEKAPNALMDDLAVIYEDYDRMQSVTHLKIGYYNILTDQFQSYVLAKSKSTPMTTPGAIKLPYDQVKLKFSQGVAYVSYLSPGFTYFAPSSRVAPQIYFRIIKNYYQPTNSQSLAVKLPIQDTQYATSFDFAVAPNGDLHAVATAIDQDSVTRLLNTDIFIGKMSTETGNFKWQLLATIPYGDKGGVTGVELRNTSELAFVISDASVMTKSQGPTSTLDQYIEYVVNLATNQIKQQTVLNGPPFTSASKADLLSDLYGRDGYSDNTFLYPQLGSNNLNPGAIVRALGSSGWTDVLWSFSAIAGDVMTYNLSPSAKTIFTVLAETTNNIYPAPAASDLNVYFYDLTSQASAGVTIDSTALSGSQVFVNSLKTVSQLNTNISTNNLYDLALASIALNPSGPNSGNSSLNLYLGHTNSNPGATQFIKKELAVADMIATVGAVEWVK